MASNSAEGKFERALRQMENVEGLIGGLPRNYRNSEEKRKVLLEVTDALQLVRIKIKYLEQMIVDEDQHNKRSVK
jgi:hypothetical protein